MLKKWTLGVILLTTSLFSQAGIINSEVISPDMVGIEVTAFFGGNAGAQDTQIWSMFSSTLGGVSTSAWSLMLDGNTFGDFDSSTNTLYGEWVLNNVSVADGIIGLRINTGIIDVYFDILSDVHTPGSEAGRPFAASDGSATAIFSDVYNSSPDLRGVMDVTDFTLNVGETLVFLTDTDKVEVPEPATMFTFALGLIALTSLRKKSSGK